MKTSGFSLVETVTVAVLASVLAGGLIGFYRFNAAQLREGTSRSLLQRHYDTAADQIGRSARAASAVLAATGEAFDQRGTYAAGTASGILMYDRAGAVTAGYRISGGFLQERDPVTGNWINFDVGSEDLRVSGGSGFGLAAGRNRLTLGFDVSRAAGNGTDVLDSRGEVYACRN